jgi:hypothetical protein
LNRDDEAAVESGFGPHCGLRITPAVLAAAAMIAA